jgi:MFS family permease
VLRLPAYRRLLVAYGVAELAYMVSDVTLSYLVYHRTGSAVGAAAFFLCAQFLPALVGPPLTARLDHRPLRWVLAALYAVDCSVFVVLAVIVGHFSVVPVLALALLDGAVTVTARPLVRAAAADVTGRAGLLHEGAALTNIVVSVTSFAGPTLAGIVVAADGTRSALVIDAVLLAGLTVTMASAAALPSPTTPRPPSRGRLAAAASYARRHGTVRTLLILQVVAVMCFTISIPVEVVYATHSLHAGAAGYGSLLSAWGGGALLGSVAYGRWRRAHPAVLVPLGAASLAVGMGVMAAAPGLAVAIIGAAFAGVGNGVEAVAARTALQEVTSSEWMALVMSFAESTQQVSPGVGILLGGGVAALAGPRSALAVGAVGAFVIAVAARAILSGAGNLDPAPAGSGPV